MDKEGNAFTFTFAVVMVVVVATVLSLVAMSLKPMQTKNIKQEKMQNILKAVRVQTSRAQALELFNKYVKKQVVLNSKGEPKEGLEAFKVGVKKQYKRYKAGSIEKSDLNYPLFICDKNDSTFYVIPMVGTGLWGPVWGYMALGPDLNTVYGTTFDHKSETPGLGAEISQRPFQKQFRGDKIFDENGNFVSIKVIKGGAAPSNNHGVDGITGGTITSVGVDEMIERTLKVYVPYFKSLKTS